MTSRALFESDLLKGKDSVVDLDEDSGLGMEETMQVCNTLSHKHFFFDIKKNTEINGLFLK